MPIPAVAAGIAGRRAAGIAGRRATTAAARKLRGVRARTRKRRKRGAPGRAQGRESDAPYILSPEGVAMLTVAIMFDFVPPIFVLALDFFFGAGELISWPLDILGTIVLGGWMWLSGGKMTFGKKLTQFLKKRAPFIVGEYIPLVGALPFWTINVFLFLKK